MNRFTVHALALVPLVFSACSTPKVENPPSPGFDAAHSDPRAIELADETLRAMGGRDAWDATRVIAWNFAGKRHHIWDRTTGDYRLDDGPRVVLMNLGNSQGRVFEGGEEVRDGDKRRTALEAAYKIWVNDSYWLLMPYKLKDTGVMLKYKGEAPLPDGRAADVLTLTFSGVGVTPDNKYEIYISKDNHLVEQWSYFKRFDDKAPTMTTPWAGWKAYGYILLANDHGKGPSTGDIAVYDVPPAQLHEVP